MRTFIHIKESGISLLTKLIKGSGFPEYKHRMIKMTNNKVGVLTRFSILISLPATPHDITGRVISDIRPQC